ncbi:MAG: enoyl-CoA hydratase/isomerase family protein [Agarilytica sp.]
MSQFIDVSHSENGHILEIAINRPDKKNALNLEMYSSITTQIVQAQKSGVRVIVLYGDGENFTSGNDLADFAGGADLSSIDNPIVQFIFALLDCSIPIVVAVQGVAVGIGTTLLMHSDLIYADPKSQFRLPFVNLGLCPEFASSYTLPRLAGHAKAAEWLMLGEFFSAAEAREVGLINAMVNDPLAVAREQANALALKPPGAMRKAKALMKSSQRATLKKIIEDELQAFSDGLKGPEFAEAVGAFFEKREPDFSSFK